MAAGSAARSHGLVSVVVGVVAFREAFRRRDLERARGWLVIEKLRSVEAAEETLGFRDPPICGTDGLLPDRDCAFEFSAS